MDSTTCIYIVGLGIVPLIPLDFREYELQWPIQHDMGTALRVVCCARIVGRVGRHEGVQGDLYGEEKLRQSLVMAARRYYYSPIYQGGPGL